MSKYIPGNQKHLTLNDRIYIENELAKGTPFKDIAAFLCKDPTTISKEVRAHRLSDWYHKGTFYNAKNFCIHRYHCQKTNACGKILLCGITHNPLQDNPSFPNIPKRIASMENLRDRMQYQLCGNNA